MCFLSLYSQLQQGRSLVSLLALWGHEIQQRPNAWCMCRKCSLHKGFFIPFTSLLQFLLKFQDSPSFNVFFTWGVLSCEPCICLWPSVGKIPVDFTDIPTFALPSLGIQHCGKFHFSVGVHNSPDSSCQLVFPRNSPTWEGL